MDGELIWTFYGSYRKATTLIHFWESKLWLRRLGDYVWLAQVCEVHPMWVTSENTGTKYIHCTCTMHTVFKKKSAITWAEERICLLSFLLLDNMSKLNSHNSSYDSSWCVLKVFHLVFPTLHLKMHSASEQICVFPSRGKVCLSQIERAHPWVGQR